MGLMIIVLGLDGDVHWRQMANTTDRCATALTRSVATTTVTTLLYTVFRKSGTFFVLEHNFTTTSSMILQFSLTVTE